MRAARAAVLSGSIDADALAWRTRVISAGGSVGSGTLAAVSRFVRSCKAADIWTKLTRINLICGDFVAARVPLVVGGGNSTETLTNIVSGDYSETGSAGGIKGNGTDKSFDTGWNPNSRGASLTNFGLWGYVRGTGGAGVSDIIIGAYDNLTGLTQLGWAGAGTVEIGAIAVNSTTEYTPSGASASKEGFLGITVNGSRAQQYYQNGAAVGSTVTATAGSFSNVSFHGLSLNVNNTPTARSVRYLRAYAITTGMSAADASAFNTAMQAFQTALGRQV